MWLIVHFFPLFSIELHSSFIVCQNYNFFFNKSLFMKDLLIALNSDANNLFILLLSYSVSIWLQFIFKKSRKDDLEKKRLKKEKKIIMQPNNSASPNVMNDMNKKIKTCEQNKKKIKKKKERNILFMNLLFCIYYYGVPECLW